MRKFTASLFFEPPSAALRFLPECPRRLINFPGGEPLLGWVAIQHSAADETGSFNILNLRTMENTVYPLPGRPGFFCETVEPGVLLIGLERRLVLYNALTGQVFDPGWIATADERCIVNDGLPVPGGVIFGTKHLAFSEHIAEIYYFEAAHHRIHRLAGGQVCSNGKHLYQQDGAAYLADICSMSKVVSRYRADLAAGSLVYDGVIADFTAGGVFPDGMKPVPDGSALVVAFYDPRPSDRGYARQYNLITGEPEAEWELPGSPRVTCPEIIELDGEIRILFTTAVEGMPDPIQRLAPHAGSMFIAPTPWTSLPPPPPLVAADTLIPI
ncbi:MAG: SMP-30/gluconolactonase/LRE family protein [Acidobacteria bacterium]|nr:SMP-30/gluconolactonase/LRE family protein [Acidobacteriota bacterium]